MNRCSTANSYWSFAHLWGFSEEFQVPFPLVCNRCVIAYSLLAH